MAAVASVALAVAWFALLIVTDGPETWVQAKVSGDGPAVGVAAAAGERDDGARVHALVGAGVRGRRQVAAAAGRDLEVRVRDVEEDVADRLDLDARGAWWCRRGPRPPASRRSACWRPARSGRSVPPSVESRMLTFAALTGAAVVFGHVPGDRLRRAAGQLTAVLGAVTANGPASARDVDGRGVGREAAAARAVVARGDAERHGARRGGQRLAERGDVVQDVRQLRERARRADVVGLNERKIGRLPLSVLGGEAVPRSYCSQA